MEGVRPEDGRRPAEEKVVTEPARSAQPPASDEPTAETGGARPSWREFVRFWAWFGWVNFGGPAAQIALLRRELVERRRWIAEGQFLRALGFCTLLPGPEAQQLATYTGALLHGTRGGVLAGALFVLPGFAVLVALSWIYAAFGETAAVAGVMYGVRSAVVALVLVLTWRLGRRSLTTRAQIVLAVVTFLALVVAKAPFPLVVLGAGLWGASSSRFAPTWFPGGAEPAATPDSAASGPAERRWPRPLPTILFGMLLWWVPPLLVAALGGAGSVYGDQTRFFAEAALVTFGGAYAVLGYVDHAAVHRFGWMEGGAMADGLGLAEPTPGPLILVVTFVGFLGAWNHPAGMSPWAAGLVGASVATWVTFVPSFMLVLLGAPLMERVGKAPALRAAMRAVGAAVVGVILNLAATLGGRVLLPESGGVDYAAAALVIVCGVGLAVFRLGLGWVLLGAAIAGLTITRFSA